MKKFLKLLIVAFFVVCPLRVHAAGAVSAGILASIEGTLIATKAMQIVEYGTMIANAVKTVQNTYDQLVKMKEAAERAIKNIQSIVDIRSIGDFMKWYNRQLYLEREVEYYYDKASLRVGNNDYKLHEIMEIPEALRTAVTDPLNKDYSEEDIKNMLINHGLSPSNYTYLRTWQEREDKIAKRILTYSDILMDEQEEAATRNQNIMNKYRVSSDDLDINEITKEAHITAMNTEMAIRENTRMMIEMYEYTLSRDKMADTPNNPLVLSYRWNNFEEHFESITEGQGTNSYRNF